MSVNECDQAWWSEVYDCIIGAVVFLDDYSAKCFHWDVGLFNMLTAAAVAVKSLSPFEYCERDQRKAVFMTQSTVTQIRTINEIISNSDLAHCILISCVSLDLVNYDELNDGANDGAVSTTGGKTGAEAAKCLEKMLLASMNDQQAVVEIIYIPLFTKPPPNEIFSPPNYTVYTKFDDVVCSKFDEKVTTDASMLELYDLNNGERSILRRFSSALNSMFDLMNIKEDIFYMGAFSAVIAGILENSPTCVFRRKSCTNAASLIIVDRTLDLCGVTSHSMESVLDNAMMPRFPGCITVHMSHHCNYYENHLEANPEGDMRNKSQNDVMSLKNEISKIDIHKSPGPKTLLKFTPQSVEKIISARKGNFDLIGKHIGILQQAKEVVSGLKSPHLPQLERLVNVEKQVLQNLSASSDSTSVLDQLADLIRTHKEQDLELEHILTLLLHVYSLTGTNVLFTKEEEENLQQALSFALLEDPNRLLLDSGNLSTHEDCERVSKNLMVRLKEVSHMRKILKKYNSVLKPDESGTGYEYRGVLQQLVDDLVDTDRPELPDLRNINEGIRALPPSRENIKEPSKHPLDNPTVILFVVGGMSAEEGKQLHRTVRTSGVDNVVLIGSTKLLTPIEAMQDVLSL